MFYFVLESSKNVEKTFGKSWNFLKKIEKKFKNLNLKNVEKMSYQIITTLKNWLSRSQKI